MSPELTDDGLERELQRRAESTRLRSDWARLELLPAVRSGVETRPQRLPSPRFAPLLGIAAVAAVLVLLVVALPRLVPGPAPTAGESSSPDGISQNTPNATSPTPALTPTSSTVDCPYGTLEAERPPEVAITDYVGLVVSCLAFAPGLDRPIEDPGPGATVANPDADTSRLDIFWTVSALCSSAPAELELMRVHDGYLLVVDKLDVGERRLACRPAFGTQGVSLELSAPVSAERVESLLLSAGRGSSLVETAGGYFYLTIGAAARDSLAGDVISVDAELRYSDAPDTIQVVGSGSGLIGFGLEQLDGDNETSPIWTADCRPYDLSVGDPLRMPFQKSGGVSDTGFFNRAYFEDPDLRLPPGIWRIYATVGFAIGECGGERIELTASLIVRTTAGPTEEPTPTQHAVPTATPVPSQVVTPPTPDPSVTSRTLDCAGAPMEPEGGSVRIEDHTGWVRSCIVSGSEDPGEPEISSKTDPPSLTVSWQVPCAADPMRTLLELWYRAPHGPEDDPSRFQPPFLMVANRVEPGTAYGCLDVVTGRQVQLVLDQSIAVTDVELFLTLRGRGIDRFVNATQEFELTIGPDTREYLVDEAIEVSASLASVGESTVTGWVGPFLGIEQLDGDLAFHPGPLISICPETSQLTADEPLVGKFNWPTTWSPRDPNADFYAHRVRDGELFLPPGVYRMYAWSRFSIGDTCSDDIVDLRTSIIVHVR